MNAHLNDGDLRAALDGELQGDARQHLENCPVCRQRQGLIQAQVQPIARRLSFLASPDRPAAPSAQAALTHFHRYTQPRKELSMFRKLF
ncbi:MAG TPA: hypothetical protein VMT91_01125, partial [Anaerolineales bacterium]|nr:hypothetical protein [Anaerolineales bacterium]